jgi:hypothetical protein
MATNDERREVARMMLEEAKFCRNTLVNNVNLRDAPAVFQDVMHCCAIDENIPAYVIFDRLADLIEPRTCRLVLREDEFGDKTEAHSCCGDMHTRDRFTGMAFRYCPNCGAEVLGDE